MVLVFVFFLLICLKYICYMDSFCASIEIWASWSFFSTSTVDCQRSVHQTAHIQVVTAYRELFFPFISPHWYFLSLELPDSKDCGPWGNWMNERTLKRNVISPSEIVATARVWPDMGYKWCTPIYSCIPITAVKASRLIWINKIKQTHVQELWPQS